MITFGTLSRRRSLIVSLLAVTAILFVRCTDAFLLPQFYAEEGPLFFADAYNLGLRSHLMPYAGYLHAVPRLIATVSTLLPYRLAPAIFVASSLIAILLVVMKLHSPRLGLTSPHLFALAVVLVPNPNSEVFLNVSNVQWILALLLLLVAVQAPPKGRTAVGDWLIALLAGLTGPFAPLLLPFFAGSAWRAREWRVRVTFAIVLAASIVQAIALVHSSMSGVDVMVDASPDSADKSWSAVVARGVIGPLFVGPSGSALAPTVVLLLAATLIIVFAVHSARAADERARAVAFLSFAAIVLILVAIKYRAAPGLLLPPYSSPRYFYLPYVMLTWTLLLVATRLQGKRQLTASALLVMIVISSLVSDFRRRPFVDHRWAVYAERIGKEPKLIVPLNPSGWAMELRGEAGSQ